MTAPQIAADRARVQAAIALASLLQRLEVGSTAANPDQYRMVVARLTAALTGPLPAHALDTILGAYPAAAELYENLHYRLSGLSRSPLPLAVQAELAARAALDRAGRRVSASSPPASPPSAGE